MAICSARQMKARRDAVRETWMSKCSDHIECLFFVGGGDPLPDEPDTIVLPSPDGYHELPQKVFDFFKFSCEHRDYDWLFKCDDDTYVMLERLPQLTELGAEIVGNRHLRERGSPSGGAGYLLSRTLVERLVAEPGLPMSGPEDIIFGEAAVRLGASPHATDRLWSMNNRYPTLDNDRITSHWCSPGRLHTIHALLHETPREVTARHAEWSDTVALFPSGVFCRRATQCSGRWREVAESQIVLEWFDWPPEVLLPIKGQEPGPGHYHCISLPPKRDEAPAELPAPDGTHCRHLAVFITTSAYGLPHINRFLQMNPGVPVHVVCNPIAPQGGVRQRAWRNCDLPMRDWWFQQGRDLNFDYAVFIEWDVVFDDRIQDVFPEDHDFYCHNRKKPGMPWSWFRHIDLLPESLRPHATGTPPMAVLRISKRCLEAVFSHPDADEAYRRDIQAELRFATLASACGFEPVECREGLRHVGCHRTQVGVGPGVWHAVKEGPQVFRRLNLHGEVVQQ